MLPLLDFVYPREFNLDSENVILQDVTLCLLVRNHLAEVAIRRAADHRDYSEITRLHTLLLRPFDAQPEFEAYAAEPPDWARQIEVSCSS